MKDEVDKFSVQQESRRRESSVKSLEILVRADVRTALFLTVLGIILLVPRTSEIISAKSSF